jgi:hypothetical protein
LRISASSAPWRSAFGVLDSIAPVLDYPDILGNRALDGIARR